MPRERGLPHCPGGIPNSRTKSSSSNHSLRHSTEVSGFKARPTLAPVARSTESVCCIASEVTNSTCTDTWSKGLRLRLLTKSRGFATNRWMSIGSRTSFALASSISIDTPSPGTRFPSIKSRCTKSTLACSSSLITDSIRHNLLLRIDADTSTSSHSLPLGVIHVGSIRDYTLLIYIRQLRPHAKSTIATLGSACLRPYTKLDRQR